MFDPSVVCLFLEVARLRGSRGLPFVTGLFGVNVGGMPGVESPGAFALLVVGLALATLLMLALFRWRRWI